MSGEKLIIHGKAGETMTSAYNVCSLNIYKPNVNERSRKTLSPTPARDSMGEHGFFYNNGKGNIGYLQFIILEYALSVAETFSASDVKLYAREKYGLELDNRRIHDAIQRLLRRGIVERVYRVRVVDDEVVEEPVRGLYRLSDSYDISIEDLYILNGYKMYSHVVESSANQLLRDGGKGQGNRLLNCGGGGCGVVRVHGVGCGGVVGFYEWLLFTYYLSRGLLPLVEGYLGRVGFSRLWVKRTRRRVRELVMKALMGEMVFGVHGFYGRGRRRGGFSMLMPMRYGCMFSGSEVGVDILVPRDTVLPKIHMKIYTAVEKHGETHESYILNMDNTLGR